MKRANIGLRSHWLLGLRRQLQVIQNGLENQPNKAIQPECKFRWHFIILFHGLGIGILPVHFIKQKWNSPFVLPLRYNACRPLLEFADCFSFLTSTGWLLGRTLVLLGRLFLSHSARLTTDFSSWSSIRTHCFRSILWPGGVAEQCS